MIYTSEFDQVLKNGYTNQTKSLLEAEVQNDINNELAGTTTVLPACHLNFGNFGNITYPWMDIRKRRINYKLFIKMEQLSSSIRSINTSIISMIEKLNCCGLAGLYNDGVLPIFDWLLKDFIGVLVDIAEYVIIANQTFKTITCILKPVAGNPWDSLAGADWFTSLFSFLNGLESIFNWLMDGNIIDTIADPVKSFEKKIGSCVPSNVEYNGDISLGNSRLQKIVDEYKGPDSYDNVQIAADAKNISDYNTYIKDLFVLQKETGDIQNNIKYYSTMNLDGIHDSLLDQLKLDLISKLESVQILIGANKQVIDDNADLIKRSDIASVNALIGEDDKLQNDMLVKQTINELIVDKYDPSCSCLSELLGLQSYKPPKFVTVRSESDISMLLTNKIHYSDRIRYQSALDLVVDSSNISTDDLDDLFITSSNLSDKYTEYNGPGELDRNQIEQLEILTEEALLLDLNSDEITYSYRDQSGTLKENTLFLIDSPALFEAGDVKSILSTLNYDLYKDIKHQTIDEMIAMRKDRDAESVKLNRIFNIVHSSKNAIEYQFEKEWNKLRRAAIEKMHFEDFSQITSEASVFDSSVYETGFTDTLDFFEGVVLLDKIGGEFEVNKFLAEFSDGDYSWNAEITGSNISELRIKWANYIQVEALVEAARYKLNILKRLDSVVIAIIDDDPIQCNCDMLCKLVQWILDIIMSTVNGLIKAVVSRIIKLTSNEWVAWIVDTILDGLQCAADIVAIEDNINEIKVRAEALKTQNSIDPLSGHVQGLDLLKDPYSCAIDKAVDLSSNEIQFSVGEPGDFQENDTEILPLPSWGVEDDNSTNIAQNLLENKGAVVGTQSAGRNIPTLTLDCSTGEKPFVELTLSDVTSYDFMLLFRPSDYILNADVVNIPQALVVEPIVSATGEVVDISTNESLNLQNIMKDILARANDAVNYPVSIEDECKENDIGVDDLKLCDTTALDIVGIEMVDLLGDPIVIGNLSIRKVSDGTVYEHFPINPDADANGNVLIPDAIGYWTFDFPADDILVGSDVVTTSDAIVDVAGVDTDITISEVLIENYQEITTTTRTQIIYLTDVDGIVTETTTITTRVTTVTPFRNPDLSFLVTFKNKVNSFKVQLLLDVLGPGDATVPYIYNPLDRYDKAEFGWVLSSVGYYNISETKLIYLSNQLLLDNGIIGNPKPVIEQLEKNRNPEQDDCLLPEGQSADVQKANEIIANITNTLLDAAISLEEATPADVVPADQPILTLPDLNYSIPLIVLNKDENIVIQIVDRKIHLQFKSNVFISSEPIVVDYILNPDDLYMLRFSTNSLHVELELITDKKEKILAKGLNISNLNLLPSILGGNVNGTESFCGQILDIIISNNNRYQEYYNRSVLSFIPRTAAIVFDFGLVEQGRVFNTITSTTDGFISDTSSITGEVTKASDQKCNYYGDILANDFHQVLSNGYLDNFFCKDNLQNIDFTISFWIYNNQQLNKDRIILLADDINKNYIYIDAYDTTRIVLDISGQPLQSYFMNFTKWTHITLKHNYLNNYYNLLIHELDGNIISLQVSSKIQFSLMSVFAEYDTDSRIYINKFGGLMSSFVLYLSDIGQSEYDILHKEQSVIVRGMENVSS